MLMLHCLIISNGLINTEIFREREEGCFFFLKYLHLCRNMHEFDLNVWTVRHFLADFHFKWHKNETANTCVRCNSY